MTSRPPPPIVRPFVRDGVRYEPGSSAPARAKDDRTAYLVAVDAASGQRLWQLPIWTVVHDPEAPPNPGRHFGSIGPGPGEHELLVRDEYGASFIVDLVTRAVRALAPAVGREPQPLPCPLPRPGDTGA